MPPYLTPDAVGVMILVGVGATVPVAVGITVVETGAVVVVTGTVPVG